MTDTLKQVIIYGGNGFVGSYIAEILQPRANVTCVSRRGNMPEHVVGDLWATKVNWVRGDASAPDLDLLSEQDIVITTIGAPPLPTITKRGFNQSVQTNGEVNRTLLEAANSAGIKSAVVMGAKIPSLINKSWFGYAVGKQLAFDAARAFSEASKQHRAVVIQPGGIFGTRHTASGRAIPLGTVMGPLAKIMPSQLISVERVAACAAAAALDELGHTDSFTVIPHGEI